LVVGLRGGGVEVWSGDVNVRAYGLQTLNGAGF